MRHFLHLLLLLLITPIASQPLTKAEISSLDDLVTADVREGAPGLAVGIIRNGEIVYEKYAGLADLDSKRPIDSQSRFNFASLAKQFTALCILRLEQEGKLALTDDIRKFLPDLLPHIEHPITIAQLLNHSSGIRGVTNLWGLQGITWWEAKQSNDDVLPVLQQQKDLNFLPGSKHQYTNTNYWLLTHVVRRASGKSFRAYADEVFKGLGMESTFFLDDHREEVPNMAKPYFNFEDWFGYTVDSDLHGDGSIYGTLRDQLRWEQILQEQTSDFLATKTIQKSQHPIPGTDISKYGFGLEFGDFRGIPYRFHHGSTGAWKATTFRFPEEQLTIFVATNSGAIWPPGLAEQCTELLIDQEKFTKPGIPVRPPEIGPAISIETILGTYRTPFGYFCKIKEKKGKLFLERFGRNDIEIKREKGNVFHEVTDPPFLQVFTYNDANELTLTFYYTNTEPFSFTKVDPVPGNFDFAAIDGTYYNEEIGVSATLQHTKDGSYKITSGEEELNGRLFTNTEMAVDGFRFQFERDNSGQINQFLLFDNRLDKVKFTRMK